MRTICRKARLWLSLVLASSAFGAGTAEPANLLAPASSVILQRGGTNLTFTDARAAVAEGRAGDVILLGPGTHRGPLLLTNAAVTLRGSPGARVNANDPDWKPHWEKAPQYGRLAYASPIPFVPGSVSVDHRIMIDAREDRGGLELHSKGLGEDSRVPSQGVYTYVEEDRVLVVSFADDRNPSNRLIEAAPRKSAAVAVRGADQCRVEGLIITGGETGVEFTDAKGSVVERCLIYAIDTGVRLGKGASSCRVLSCDLTMNPDSLSLDCESAAVGKAVWHAHKQAGTYDKRCVLADQAGEGNEVAYNYLYNMWDGIDIDSGVGKGDVEAHYKDKVAKGIADFNRGLKVHHNRLDLAHDDALEPGDVLADNQWYANVVTRARVAVRFKTISIGPFFFYDNVVLDSGTGLRLYKSTPESAKVYIFNNLVRNRFGIVYLKIDSVCWDDPWLASVLPKGTPGFRLFNNVFVCSEPFGNLDGKTPPNFISDYNLFTGTSSAAFPPKGSDRHSLFGASPSFGNVTNGDWRLAEGSPGKGAGCALSTFCPDPPAGIRELAGKTPDMGVLGLAPDGRGTPRGPVSGLWELAVEPLNLEERDVTRFSLDPARPAPLRPLWGRGVPGTGPINPAVTEPAKPKTPPVPEPPPMVLGDGPVQVLKNGTFTNVTANGITVGWQNAGFAEAAVEKGGLRLTTTQVAKEQGSLSQVVAGLPPHSRLVLTGKVRGSRDKAAYLQLKLKQGKKEIGRVNSLPAGTEERELKIECEAGEATSVSVQIRYSQEAAGESVWVSDLKLSASAAR